MRIHKNTTLWFDFVLQDLRFALRLMRRHPLLTATVVAAVALGVGANTAIVSVLQTLLLNPLGLHDADRVMVARVRIEKLQMRHAPTSAVEFREIGSMTDAFSAVAAMEQRAWRSQAGGAATRLLGQAVTTDFFRVFGERPSLGRFFVPEDDAVAVLSHDLWRSRFGGDSSVIGGTLMLDDTPHRIVGIAAAQFRFPAGAQAWTPLVLTPGRLKQRGYNMNLSVFVRLREDVTSVRAIDRINRHVANLKSAPEGRDLAKLGYGIDLDPLAHFVAGDLRTPLWLLWAAALVVLVTGCANVSGLLLARSAGRAREMAIRISLGATPLEIFRQLMLESVMLGALGGLAGILVAAIALPVITRLAIPQRQLLELVQIDGRLLLYALALALVSGLLFGLAPAIQLLRENQTAAMGRSRRRWFQDLFVTAEVAGTLLLVVSTGLLLRSLWLVEQVRPGFDPGHVTTAFFMKPQNDPGFLDRLTRALRSSAGIQSAALAYPVPFHGGGLTSSFGIRNQQPQPGEPEWHAEAYMISPGYLETLHIPLLRGRDLSDSDAASSPLVCLIDSKFAQRFFSNQDPIGQEIQMYRGWARIVGVAGQIRATTLESSSRPVVYYSLAQVPFFEEAAIVARSSVSAAAAIREAVRATSAAVPLYDMKSMEERIAESLGIRRVVVLLLGVFGSISLLLAAIGLYGVVAQVVSERTRETGIRMALGARPVQILTHYMGQGMRSGMLGLVIGLTAAIYTQRWITEMLYVVEPFDPISFCAASIGVVSVLLLALWWPARRASRIAPQEALRCE